MTGSRDKEVPTATGVTHQVEPPRGGGGRLGRRCSAADHSCLHRLELGISDDTAAPQVGEPGKVVDGSGTARGRGEDLGQLQRDGPGQQRPLLAVEVRPRLLEGVDGSVEVLARGGDPAPRHVGLCQQRPVRGPLGSGRRLFPDGPPTELTLVDTKTSSSGVILATYEAA